MYKLPNCNLINMFINVIIEKYFTCPECDENEEFCECED